MVCRVWIKLLFYKFVLKNATCENFKETTAQQKE